MQAAVDTELRGTTTGRRRLDTVLVPAAVLLALGIGFVVLRLFLAAGGDIGNFINLGTRSVDPGKLSTDLTVHPGHGYDGQFYYRFALNPGDLSTWSHGIHLDTPLRQQRIGYPVLAWLLAFGQAALVPLALVIVNVLALGALGLVSGLWARSYGRHALWGLLPAGFFGLVWSLARDLTEITTVTFLVAALVAIRRERPYWAALALIGTVLSRETTVVVVIALLVTRLVAMARKRAKPGRDDVTWLAPLLVYAGWLTYCTLRYGTFPLLAERSNTGPPGVAATQAAVHWLTTLNEASLVQLAQLAVLGLVLLLALFTLRSSSATSVEKVAFVLSLVLLVCLSDDVWNDDPDEFRSMAETFTLGCGLLLGARRAPVALPAAGTWLLWLAIAALRVKSL